jgi:hypothetical protein
LRSALAAGFISLFAWPALAMSVLSGVNTSILEAQGWQMRKENARLTLACGDFEGFVATNILLESARDGTEKRIRSGETTAATMLPVCRENAQAKGSECFGLKEADLAGAVGFVSDVGLGPMGFASTYVLWQNGKRLTIRSVAPTRAEAARVGRLMFKSLASQIVE